MTKYLLLPGADTRQLGRAHYLFDRTALETNVVSIPPQRVSLRAAKVVKTLRAHDLHRFPRTREEIVALFRGRAERAFVEKLFRAGYLDAVTTPPSRPNRRAASAGSWEAVRFRERGLPHFFKKPTFFNLPDAIDDDEVQVGLFGVPFSSTGVSSGSAYAPGFLRMATAQRAFWFDIYQDGFHSDVGVGGGPRDVLGKGVVAKDYGDVGPTARRVRDLFEAIDDVVERHVVGRRIRPLFVGGDHAITFPIVHALLKRIPDLCLLHLDAHHDLFFSTLVDYHHASPIRSLLAYSGLQKACSFGLRTTFDPRVAPHDPATSGRALSNKVHGYSLPAFRRLLAEPKKLDRELARVAGGRPFYLSIDVDVVSAAALSGRTSTPAGAGLEWTELMEAVQALFAGRNIVAADLVEVDPFAARAPGGDELAHLPALLALLLHELAKSRPPSRRAASARRTIRARVS